MKIFLITIITLILTFLVDLIFRKTVEKKPFKVGKYKIHHSVLGVALFIAGVLIANSIILSIGLGIYLSHGVEAMYFDGARFPGSFFILVTRVRP